MIWRHADPLRLWADASIYSIDMSDRMVQLPPHGDLQGVDARFFSLFTIMHSMIRKEAPTRIGYDVDTSENSIRGIMRKRGSA